MCNRYGGLKSIATGMGGGSYNTIAIYCSEKKETELYNRGNTLPYEVKSFLNKFYAMAKGGSNHSGVILYLLALEFT